MTERESFGLNLRHERERRGLTLAAVAESTKISPYLLTSLERGDVSRWPGGIYRRSFLRSYACAVGLPAEETLQEFLRLFRENGQVAPAALDSENPGLRITLAPEPRWKWTIVASAAALADGAAVLLIGYGASMISGQSAWVTTVVAALAYQTTATILLGRTPGVQCLLPGLGFRSPRASTADDLAEFRRGWPAGWIEPAKPRSENRVTT